jgi:hypothetical protein
MEEELFDEIMLKLYCVVKEYLFGPEEDITEEVKSAMEKTAEVIDDKEPVKEIIEKLDEVKENTLKEAQIEVVDEPEFIEKTNLVSEVVEGTPDERIDKET